MTVFTKKIIKNFLFLHITDQKFNTILESCCILRKIINYQFISQLLKKGIYFEKWKNEFPEITYFISEDVFYFLKKEYAYIKIEHIHIK